MTTQQIIIVVVLIAVVIAVRVVVRKARPAPPFDPNSFMSALSDEAVKFSAARGVTLDYSPGSVERVESLLGELHQSRAMGKLPDADLNLRAHQFGAYVGEVLRRAYGGRWTEDHEVAGPRSFPIHWKDGQSFPVGWCGKRILNGDEDNVWVKYQVVTSDEYQGDAMTRSSDGPQPPTESPTTQPAIASPADVRMVNPQDVLFSTSTLNDALPPLTSDAPGEDCVRMHEDDWRQFEFVHAAFDAQVAEELSAIDAIWKDQAVPVGEGMTAFRSVHVRKAVAQPMDAPMTVAAFEQMFGGRSRPITFHGYDRVARDVHAIPLDGGVVVVYAVIRGDRVYVMGIEASRAVSLNADVLDRVERFVTENDLRLVHWRSRTLFPSPGAAMRYLRGSAG